MSGVNSAIVNPTRMEQARLKNKLLVAKKGHKRLKDKRDELMRRFLNLIDENIMLRKKVEKGISEANQNLVLAKAVMGEEALSAALLQKGTGLVVNVESKNVMNTQIPSFDFEIKGLNAESDFYSYGFAFTSGDLDTGLRVLSDVFPYMIKLAETEKACQLMAAEIERTRRRVNALEYVMIPETEMKIKYISMKLDENERSTRVRLMKIKNMAVKSLAE